MMEFVFLFCLALIWILFATFSDFKTREIYNWLNFSLIIFALVFRFFYSLFESNDFNIFFLGLLAFLVVGLVLMFLTSSFKNRTKEFSSFFAISVVFIILIFLFSSNPNFFNFFVNPGSVLLYSGIIGLMIFFILGNLLYYGRMFAGGDTKLMISLGAILPIFPSLIENLKLFLIFFMIFLIVGAVYGLFRSVFIGLKNFNKFEKGFKKLFSEKKKMVLAYMFFGIVFLALGFWRDSFAYFGIFIFIFPYFYLFLKSVDDYCMVRKIFVSKLTPGDWLYKDVKVGKKIIRASWDGLSKEEIKLLKGKKEVFVRYGIVFAPVFLISFALLWILIEFNLISFIWGFF